MSCICRSVMPQQNAFIESFIGRLRDKCLNETVWCRGGFTYPPSQ